MKRTILALMAGFMLALAIPASAEITVPDGKAAVAEAVLGKVSADQGEGFKALKVGADLAPGSTLKTGANGRVALRLPDGSAARLAPNTEFTLKAETKRLGVFTRLLKGTVRFLVVKQTAGRNFETELPNAVAAVKGTDPEYGTDGKQSTAKVFSSGNPVALLLTDPKTGKEQALAAGEKLSFDGSGFNVEKITDQDREDSDKNYQGLPVVIELEKDKEAKAPAKTEGAKAEGSGSSAEGASEADAAMNEATEKAMAEATEELYLDGFLERDERTGDIAAGKIIYDRFGQRVQVSHFITRDDESSVTIASFSLRDAGPNQGVSTAIESSTFNQALPTDWGQVFRRKLDDPANLDASGYPVYFRTSELFLAANPAGDSVLVNTLFDEPTWSGVQGGPLDQGYSQDLYVNGQTAFSFSYGDLSQANHVSPGGLYPTKGYWANNVAPFEGGWRFDFTDTNTTFLSEDVHLLDDKGGLQDHPTFDGALALPRFLKGVDANVEVAFNSPLFEGRSIDVLFLPGFFDLYDMFNEPDPSHYNLQ